MPIRLNIGINKKVGLPDYGSLGACCHVDVEVEGCHLFDDLESFHQKVRQVYIACAQAVDDELIRRQSPARLAGKCHETGIHASDNGGTSANGKVRRNSTATRRPNGSGVSQKQIEYAQQLAGQIPGLGTSRLDALASEMFGLPLARLSSSNASGLIDTLRTIKDGRLELNAVLEEATR